MTETPRHRDAKSSGKVRQMATEDTFLAAYTRRRAGQQHDREVLTFRLADEIYGLDISWMREISKMRPITEVPQVPAFLPGIITLRGTVIPIIDLRRRLMLPAADATGFSRILIVENEEEPFGLIVDQVLKVVRMVEQQVESAPLPGGIDSEFLAGVARVEEELIVLLNLPMVVTFSLEVSSR